MILASLRMKASAAKRNEAVQIFKSVCAQTTVQTGCVFCRVFVDLQDSNMLMLEQMWKTQKDLNTYLRSEECYRLLLAMELAASKPEVRFDIISTSSGMEIIEKARKRRAS